MGCDSALPCLVSLENSRFSAVFEQQLGCDLWGFYRSMRLIGSGAPRCTKTQNIFGRVDIPIVISITIMTVPIPYFEGHFRLVQSAFATGFAGGGKSVHDKYLISIPLAPVRAFAPVLLRRRWALFKNWRKKKIGRYQIW
jgi:hypothetical protein